MQNKFSYYNEYDKKTAAWLRKLIKYGLIADGEVDERSIIEVQASDVRGFTQCHFFAGIGGWSYALRLAGIPDSEQVWTASLPCQPFSVAGLGKGKSDERHLLPHFLDLVRECNPNRMFGEQVEGAIRHGWLDDLQTTMEAEGYAVRHCVLGAHSVSAPHIRKRLYWVADSIGARSKKQSGNREVLRETISNDAGENIERSGELCWMGDTNINRSQPWCKTATPARYRHTINSTSWDDPEWLYCRDNKYRPVKSGLKPLVDGVPKRMVRGCDQSEPLNADCTSEARVMRLKGYGNAIVPQVAAEFIRAFYAK